VSQTSLKLNFLKNKKWQWLLLLNVVFCILPGYLKAQSSPLKFEYLTAIDGLSHNKVQCILQDRQGYIWFGTIYGLNRYDGYTFKIFENIPGDSSSIANNNIIGLYQDNAGTIWIGTSTTLSSYDPHTETFKNYDLPVLNGWIHSFAEDETGLLWVATGSGLFSFDKKTMRATMYKTDDSARENIHSILKDNNNPKKFNTAVF